MLKRFKNDNFNLITLRPFKKTDREDFFKFTEDDVRRMFIMKSLVMTGVWLAYFIEFLFNRRREDRDYAVVYGIYMLISLLCVGVGLRFKKAMIPLIILSYPALETCHILIWRFIAEPLD